MSRKKGKKTRLKNFLSFFREDKFKITFGTFLILMAAYMIIAFISYFFTWKADQDFTWTKVFSGPEITVDNHSGKLGAWMSNIFITKWFGIASFFIPVFLMVLGSNMLGMKLFHTGKSFKNLAFSTILLSVIMGFFFSSASEFLGSGPGGSHGLYMSQWLEAALGKAGTIFLLIILTLGFVLYNFNNPRFLFRNRKKDKENINDKNDEKVKEGSKQEGTEIFEFEEEEATDLKDNKSSLEKEENSAKKENHENNGVEMTIEQINEEEEIEKESLPDFDPTLELSGYKIPPLSLLVDHETGNPSVSNEELISNKNKIVETLANYKITIDKIKATIGPTVTLYEIVPAPGIRISKIKNLEDDIALSLAALGIRIIAPIPGKGTIGIEVPNQRPRTVSMRNVLSSKKFQESNFELPVCLGKTISNETYAFDLTKMPHLLVAGATGQGKSVGLNAVIASLLFKKHPAQLKFVLVDPKKVELTLYSKIERHFLAKLPDTEEAIITDTQKVINTLNSLTIEMDQRYTLLKQAHVRNIKEYNQKFIKRKLNPDKGHKYLPYIVLIIDEFADLIMTAGREIENPIARLAQLARAVGIHLIIATQRPTTNIITGVIKANFPARIAFRVMSVVDSRTILDTSGANQLIGRGDMLISSGNEPARLQCAFIDTPEIDNLTEYIGNQKAFPTAFILPEVVDEQSESFDVDLKKRDSKFEDAARLVVQYQQGSTSLIQRKLSLGYNRAGRIVDQLEAAGILGPFEGSKAREVLIKDEMSLEQILNSID